MPDSARKQPPEDSPSLYRNEILIAGRLAAPALARTLPSGDDIVNWRLIVDRDAGEGARRVDVVDCTAFRSRVRRQALVWNPGEIIEVSGALRRRFWRGAIGLQSKYEVEVESAKRRSASAAQKPAIQKQAS